MIPTNLELALAESFFVGGEAKGMKSNGRMEGARQKEEKRKKVQGEKKGDVVRELYLAVMWVLLSGTWRVLQPCSQLGPQP